MAVQGHDSDCKVCRREVLETERGVACDRCDDWYHTVCVQVSDTLSDSLNHNSIMWFCGSCVPLIRQVIKCSLPPSGNTTPLDGKDLKAAEDPLTTNPVKVVDERSNDLSVGPKCPQGSGSPAGHAIAVRVTTGCRPHSEKISQIVSVGPKVSRYVPCDEWKMVKTGSGKTTKMVIDEQHRELALCNRFSILKDMNSGNCEFTMVGDSIIKDQDREFCSKGNGSRKRICLPGAGIQKVNDTIALLPENSGEIVVHVGTNELTTKHKGKITMNRNSEEVISKFSKLLKSLASRQHQCYVVGVLPRIGVGGELTSRMVGLNDRLKGLCDYAGVLYIDLWDHFHLKRHFFRDDGLHLSAAGSKLYGRLVDEYVKEMPLGFH